MTKESEKHLEDLNVHCRNFVIFIYKNFGGGNFLYGECRNKLEKIPFWKRRDLFGSLSEKSLHSLAERNILEVTDNVIGRKKRCIYKLEKRMLSHLENLGIKDYFVYKQY